MFEQTIQYDALGKDGFLSLALLFLFGSRRRAASVLDLQTICNIAYCGFNLRRCVVVCGCLVYVLSQRLVPVDGAFHRRSYFTQRLQWDVGQRLAFCAPFVTQCRNPHSYLAAGQGRPLTTMSSPTVRKSPLSGSGYAGYPPSMVPGTCKCRGTPHWGCF